MINKKIAERIANALREGTLVHPGTEERPPTPVVLSIFRTTGMPPEMVELAEGTANLLAEAVVALIEEEHEIIEKGQATEMRVANAATPHRVVTVHCGCDTQRTDPLAVLTVTNNPHVTVSGKQLIEGLANREPECPHERKS